MKERVTNPLRSKTPLPEPLAAHGCSERCCENGNFNEQHDCCKAEAPAAAVPQPSLEQRLELWYQARIAWPISKLLGRVLCLLGLHAWEDASVTDHLGTPRADKPGLYKRCARPACRIYRDRPDLKVVVNPETGCIGYMEVTDDFEVLARASCPKCQGRGSSRRLLLPSEAGFRVSALLPCECLRIQPRFVRREKASGR